MTRRILFVTGNVRKLEEVRQILIRILNQYIYKVAHNLHIISIKMINICNNLFVFLRYYLNKYLIIYETDFPIFEGFKDWEFLNKDMSDVFTRFILVK